MSMTVIKEETLNGADLEEMPEGSKLHPTSIFEPSGYSRGFKRVLWVSSDSLPYISGIFPSSPGHREFQLQRVPGTLCGAQRVPWDLGSLEPSKISPDNTYAYY